MGRRSPAAAAHVPGSPGTHHGKGIVTSMALVVVTSLGAHVIVTSMALVIEVTSMQTA